VIKLGQIRSVISSTWEHFSAFFWAFHRPSKGPKDGVLPQAGHRHVVPCSRQVFVQHVEHFPDRATGSRRSGRGMGVGRLGRGTRVSVDFWGTMSCFYGHIMSYLSCTRGHRLIFYWTCELTSPSWGCSFARIGRHLEEELEEQIEKRRKQMESRQQEEMFQVAQDFEGVPR
jgi:hypothetical protein